MNIVMIIVTTVAVAVTCRRAASTIIFIWPDFATVEPSEKSNVVMSGGTV